MNDKYCIGCGIKLQDENMSLEGYTTSLENDICSRCFRMKNYGEYQVVTKSNDDYIEILNNLKANLFNKNVYSDYRLGLSATEHAKLAAALTSILKFETEVGVKGVDMGVVDEAYGVQIFPINDTMLGAVKGYFYNPLAVVGDSFFDSFVEYNNNYPGFPGYYVMEGNIMFGAKVVEPNAIIKLVAA